MRSVLQQGKKRKEEEQKHREGTEYLGQMLSQNFLYPLSTNFVSHTTIHSVKGGIKSFQQVKVTGWETT